MSDRIFILGAGRAGRGLARALRASGAEVVGLHGRRRERDGEEVTTGTIPSGIGDAGVVLVTVRDRQLDGALGELLEASLAPGTVVLHASGSAEPRAVAELRSRGHPAGTFHPLVPLPDPARAPAVLRGAWIGIDGDPPAIEAARRLATRIDANVITIPEGQKARYHAAAVFAANFPTVLASIAGRLLRDTGVRDDEAWPAVIGLMAASVRSMRDRRPSDALTGPIVRGDVDTVAHHLQALASDPALDAYVALSRVAVELARAAGTEPTALGAMEKLIADR